MITQEQKIQLSIEAQAFVDNAIAETRKNGGDLVTAVECLFHWLTEAARTAQEAAQQAQKELKND